MPKGRESYGDGVPIVVVGVCDPPGRTRESSTGRSGTGDLMDRNCKVREMRIAEMVLNIIRDIAFPK